MPNSTSLLPAPLRRVNCTVFSAGPPAPQGAEPDATTQQQADVDRGASHVLGTFGQVVPLWTDSVNRRLNAGVEQFHDQDKGQAGNEKPGFEPVLPKPECGRHTHQADQGLLTESRFEPGGVEPLPGIDRGKPDSRQPLAFG